MGVDEVRQGGGFGRLGGTLAAVKRQNCSVKVSILSPENSSLIGEYLLTRCRWKASSRTRGVC